MPWHKFLFPEKQSHRWIRHAIFWMVWWLYFAFSQYLYQQPPAGKFKPLYVTVGDHLFIKTFFLVLLSAVACYVFIYLLLPQLVRGRWWKVVASTLLLCISLYGAGYWLYWTGFPLIDSLFGRYHPASFPTRFWPAVNLGLWEPLKVVAAAGILQYAKHGWLKQRESQRLEKEKIETELQLLKAQIQPGFLLTSLNYIYSYLLAGSPQAPQMLLKLSDLLSYMLYECDRPLVPLDKELMMMKDYMALEKMRLPHDLEMELNVSGDTGNQKIAPFLLLPFIENSFRHNSSPTDQAWINLDIHVEENIFLMKLAHGTAPDENGLPLIPENSLNNIQKRLNLIYPQQHELRMSREREMLIVLLKIHLAETRFVSLEEENVVMTELTNLHPTVYAAS